MIRKLISSGFIITALASFGYGREATYSFLKVPVVGDPIFTNGFWLLPVNFETEIAHSAIWVRGGKIKIVNNEIFIQASLAHPPLWGKAKDPYPGHLELGRLQDGEYLVSYLDPDGNSYPLRKIMIGPRK